MLVGENQAFQFNNGDSINTANLELEWQELNTPDFAFCIRFGITMKLLEFIKDMLSPMTEMCPSEWHVSTDADWIELESFAGMQEGDWLASGAILEVYKTRGYKLRSVIYGSDEFG